MENKKEEKIDKILGNLLKDDGIEKSQSQDFTSTVMRKINAYESEKAYNLSTFKQFVLILVGLSFFLTIASIIYYMVKSNAFNEIFTQVKEFLSPVLGFLPFEISPWFILGIGIHLIIVRVVVLFYLYKFHGNIKRNKFSGVLN